MGSARELSEEQTACIQVGAPVWLTIRWVATDAEGGYLPSSKLTITAALAMTMASLPSSLRTSSPPCTAVT